MNTEENNTQLPQSSVSERFSHTIENCLFAKQELLKDGFSEDDFYYADSDDVEVGLLIGEPIMKSNDDDCVTALELYKQKCFSEEEDEDKMIEFFLREGL